MELLPAHCVCKEKSNNNVSLSHVLEDRPSPWTWLAVTIQKIQQLNKIIMGTIYCGPVDHSLLSLVGPSVIGWDHLFYYKLS